MTNNEVSFFVNCKPPTATAQLRRWTTKGKTYQPPKVKQAAAKLQAMFEQNAPKAPFSGAVALTLIWTYPGPRNVVRIKETRPDLDNLSKLAIDALVKANFIVDDALVADFRTRKFTGPIPGVFVRIKKMRPED